jgi:hypothetical protein
MIKLFSLLPHETFGRLVLTIPETLSKKYQQAIQPVVAESQKNIFAALLFQQTKHRI